MMNDISTITTSSETNSASPTSAAYAIMDTSSTIKIPYNNNIELTITNAKIYPAKSARLVPDILKITHPNNTTVVYWADETTTSVRLMPGETYDKYAAFCACVVKKLYGSTTRAKKICDKYDFEAMQAKERELREKEEEKLRAKAKRRLKARIKRRARELYIEEEARKLAAVTALKADK